MHRATRTSIGLLAGVLIPAALVTTATPALAAAPFLAERVYVETTLDTDGDGAPDRIALDINRPATGKFPTIMELSPYVNGVDYDDLTPHPVNVDQLPQETAAPPAAGEVSAFSDGEVPIGQQGLWSGNLIGDMYAQYLAEGYATVVAHSLGTGSSSGCPDVGNAAETQAGVAVIDWLNGRAKGFTALSGGTAVTADWSTGKVGMTGASYVGALANQVATTGVDGLAAIVPVAAIANWYDYTRANGLVVGPMGGPQGDVDLLAKAIVKKGRCTAQIAAITRDMGRETGDWSQFWEERNYVDDAARVKAAVLVVHGLADTTVKGTQYAEWYEALARAGKARKILLHEKAHATGASFPGYQQLLNRWWDHWLKGIDNGVDREPRADVNISGTWTKFADWPNPDATPVSYQLGAADPTAPGTLTTGSPASTSPQSFTDQGRTVKVATLIADGDTARADRVVYRSEPLTTAKRLTAAPQVTLNVAVENKTAANLTVALVSYDSTGKATLLTRGWADPQNAAAPRDPGRPLTPGTPVTLSFKMEPQERLIPAGNRIGLVVASTDNDFTLRPTAGTRLRIEPAGSSLSLLLG